MDEEDKKIQIQPLPAPETIVQPAPKKVGRPRVRPPKVESHVATPARLKALEKARVVKAANRYKKEKEAKAAHQADFTGRAFPTQGYNYGPYFDNDASMAQAAPSYDQGYSRPVPYQNPTFGRPEIEDKISRVEVLLSRLLADQNTQPSPPQNTIEEPRDRLEPKATIFNTNPYLMRRYGRK